MTNAFKSEAHKESGDQPFAPGTRVYSVDYVVGDREGVVVGRVDTDEADSYSYFIYEVKLEGVGIQYLDEFKLRRL